MQTGVVNYDIILYSITVASDATPSALDLKTSGISAASLVESISVIVLTIPSRNMSNLWCRPPPWCTFVKLTRLVMLALVFAPGAVPYKLLLSPF